MKRLLLFILAFPFLLNAQDFPEKPSNYITDEANILSNEQEQSLNSKLRNFEDSSTNQIFVYVASSLNGNDLSDLSQKIFHTWKIGQDAKNNGVLIAIFINDHKFRIQTGYGLEGVLPDLVTKHIQDNDMRPFFKENKYYEGIDKGVGQLIYYCKHEFKADNTSTEESDGSLFIFFYAFSAAFLLITILLARKIQDSQLQKSINYFKYYLFVIPFLGTFILLIMIFIALSYRKDLIKTSNVSTWASSSDSSWSSSDNSSSWSSSDSIPGSSFDGGGGGDSGGGGSSSDW